MSLSILTSKFSFYSFDSEDTFVNCGFPNFGMCLPVFADNDVAFQFKIVASSKVEADILCDLANNLVQIGIIRNCNDTGFLQTYSQKTERYRVNDNTVLYNWTAGLPNFEAVVQINQCFHIKVVVNGTAFCSNCLQRVGESCYSAVLDYNNNDDAFDFDYCGGSLVGSSTDVTCEPTFVPFTNLTTLAIPYTASLSDKYGSIPTVTVWIYNLSGELVNMGTEVTFDSFPPSIINFDFGGLASGVIKIN